MYLIALKELKDAFVSSVSSLLILTYIISNKPKIAIIKSTTFILFLNQFLNPKTINLKIISKIKIAVHIKLIIFIVFFNSVLIGCFNKHIKTIFKVIIK